MNSSETELNKIPDKRPNIFLRLLGPGLVTGADPRTKPPGRDDHRLVQSLESAHLQDRVVPFGSPRSRAGFSFGNPGPLTVFPSWPKWSDTMWSPWKCVAVICFVVVPKVQAEPSGLAHRASCSVVRFYVAKYTAVASEAWARSHGITEADIEAARHCLKEQPQSPQAAQLAGQ